METLAFTPTPWHKHRIPSHRRQLQQCTSQLLQWHATRQPLLNWVKQHMGRQLQQCTSQLLQWHAIRQPLLNWVQQHMGRQRQQCTSQLLQWHDSSTEMASSELLAAH